MQLSGGRPSYFLALRMPVKTHLDLQRFLFADLALPQTDAFRLGDVSALGNDFPIEHAVGSERYVLFLNRGIDVHIIHHKLFTLKLDRDFQLRFSTFLADPFAETNNSLGSMGLFVWKACSPQKYCQ